MPVFSAAISDNYCVSSKAAICISANYIREYIEQKGSGNAKADNAIKVITGCLREKFGLSLDKDFEHIGAFIVPSESGETDFIGFVTGDFDSKQKTQTIENFVLSLSEEAKLEKIQKKDGVVPTFVGNGCRLMFLNSNVILFGKDSSILKVINGGIAFGKAPESVTDLLSNSDSFIQVAGSGLPLLGQILQIPSVFDTLSIRCDKVWVYIKGSKLNFDIAYYDNEKVGNIKSLADETKKKYLEQNEKSLSEANDKLKQVPIKDFFDVAKNMYSVAKTLDYLEQIIISQENNIIHITAPYNRTQLIIGAIGVVSSIAATHFKKARESARTKACYANIRVLHGALEMYNMDHSVMMTELDIQKLVDGKYLKNEPSKPDPGCSYYSEGDMTRDGMIKCRLHGDPEAGLRKACYSNISVILGAVEMYNMDHYSAMMTELDIQKLVDGKYLKNEPSKPYPGCSYYSEGDLTEDGMIKCRLHGNPR